MAHTSDLVAAVVAAHGTRLLRARSGPRFEAASELLRIGLSEDRPGWAFLRFIPGDLALDLWMDELRASGAEAVLLVDVEAARRAPPPGVPAAALHAFSGSSTLGPGVQRAGQIEPYAP